MAGSRLADRFPDFAATKTAGADLDPLGAALFELDPNFLEIRLERAVAHVMGVGHVVSEHRFFAATITNLGHDSLVKPRSDRGIACEASIVEKPAFCVKLPDPGLTATHP